MGNLYQGSVALGASGGGVGSLEELGVIATATELNYVDGVTSNVQTQLNNKIGLYGNGETDGATGLKNLFASGETVLSHYQYGDELPMSSTAGKMFLIPDNDVNVQIVKVWENASPDSSFAAQTVSLDLADANWVAIAVKAGTSGSIDKMNFIEVGKADQMFMFANAGASSAIQIYTRRADVSTTGVEFGTSNSKTITGTSASSSSSNVIPLRIYAIKGVVS